MRDDREERSKRRSHNITKPEVEEKSQAAASHTKGYDAIPKRHDVKLSAGYIHTVLFYGEETQDHHHHTIYPMIMYDAQHESPHRGSHKSVVKKEDKEEDEYPMLTFT